MKKNVLQSRTTQNVFIGGFSVAAVLATVRKLWPDVMPWGVETDAAIDSVIMVVLVPFISRLIARLRGQVRDQDILTPLVILCCIGAGLLACTGCATTTTLPDGTVIEGRLDAEASAAAAQIVAALGNEGLAFLDRLYELQDQRDQARTARERAEQAERLQRYVDLLREIAGAVGRQSDPWAGIDITLPGPDAEPFAARGQ